MISVVRIPDELRNRGECMVHELKILHRYFVPVKKGLKRFEIRKNDRNFGVGDVVILKEWEYDEYTGREVRATITYVTNYEQQKGYVVFGFDPIDLKF